MHSINLLVLDEGAPVTDPNAYAVQVTGETQADTKQRAERMAAQLYWNNAEVYPKRIVCLDSEPYLRSKGTSAKDGFEHRSQDGRTTTRYADEQTAIMAQGRRYTAAIEAMPVGCTLILDLSDDPATLTRIACAEPDTRPKCPDCGHLSQHHYLGTGLGPDSFRCSGDCDCTTKQATHWRDAYKSKDVTK